uniref:Alliinase C-terminal domain-containing protein n=1 Tax=Populus alba TaxID=43335 RepID=A0A4V5ZZ58_POPAL|nr:hypothetical protein D5086_0000313320 [Populus alba]
MGENFFEYSHSILKERWERLRNVVKNSRVFSLPKYPRDYCNFTGNFCMVAQQGGYRLGESRLREHQIIARSGERFGASPKHVRISMFSPPEAFNLFLERLSAIIDNTNGNVVT